MGLDGKLGIRVGSVNGKIINARAGEGVWYFKFLRVTSAKINSSSSSTLDRKAPTFSHMGSGFTTCTACTSCLARGQVFPDCTGFEKKSGFVFSMVEASRLRARVPG